MVAKVLKIFGFIIVGIILALVVAPFVLKDDIIKEVKKKINENINAEVEFSDVDISFLKSFPEVSISINDLKVVGVDTFYNVDLINAKKLNLDFSVLPFFDKTKPLSLKYIGLEDGKIDLLVLNDTLANYLITKPTDDTTSFKLALEGYELKRSQLIYNDRTLQFKAIAKGVNHQGSGNLDGNLYDLLTKTKVDSLTVSYEGTTYMKNIATSLDAIINVDLNQNKFTLKENDLRLNKLKIKGDGSIHFVNDQDMAINAKLKSESAAFADFLSVLPHLSSYNTVAAKGQVALAADINGVLNNVSKKYPAYDVKIDIANGSAQYAGLPQAITNVNGKINIKSTRSDMKDFLVRIKDFNAQVGSEKVSGNFDINDGFKDPHIIGNLDMNIRLENWAKAIPMTDVEKLTGKVDANLKFDARQSDIDNERYSAVKFDGKSNISDLNYKIKGKQPITVQSAILTATPALMEVTTSGMQLGKSDASLNGKIINPMAYFSDVKNVRGEMNLTSNLLDLNEWISEENKSTSNSGNIGQDMSLYKYNEVDVVFDIKKLIYGNHIVEAMKGKGKLGIENIDIAAFTAKLDESTINFNGKLANVYSYLFNNEVLVGDINLSSNYFDANKYMVKSENVAPSEDSILFSVPDRMDLKIQTKIDELKYTNMDLKNFNGVMNVKNNAINLNDITANVLGGKFNFNGLYETGNKKYPGFSIKLDLAKMEFNKAYKQFVTMRQLAPISNYIQGIFNTTLVFEGNLKKGMTPDLSNITAQGFIETLNGILKGFKPVQTAGEKLGIAELANLDLKDTKNWFDIKKGVVEVKEFTKNIKGIDLKMSGNHKIQGAMAYDMFLRVPRKMLKKSNVTAAVDKGISFIEKEAAKRGVNVAQGEFIDLSVKISGSLTNPKIEIIPLGTSGKSLKEEIKEEVEQKLELVKDSVEKVVIQKTNEIKDSIRTRAEQEVEKAKDKVTEKATEVINEAKDKVKKEVEARVDSIVGKAVSDSLKKKAEDLLKRKTGKEVDDIKNKVKDWNPFKKPKPKDGGG
jgi:hypothetical protein